MDRTQNQIMVLKRQVTDLQGKNTVLEKKVDWLVESFTALEEKLGVVEVAVDAETKTRMNLPEAP